MKRAFSPAVRFAPAWLLCAAMALLGSAGCGGGWVVVKQANPNPLTPQKSFAVEPVIIEGSVTVGKETSDSYVARKSKEDPAFGEKWKGDMDAINQAFATAIVSRAKGLQVSAGAPAQAGPYLIRGKVTFLEPGFFGFAVNGASQVHMTVQIADPQGAVVDEITVNRSVAPGNIMGVPVNTSTRERFKECGKLIGEAVANYLRQRTGVK